MSLIDYVLDNSTNDEEINLANKIGASNFIDGTTCDDNNDETINDIYNNSVCSGILSNGVSCNDNNA